VHTALLTLKEGFEGQLSGSNIEVGIVGPNRVFKVCVPTSTLDIAQWPLVRMRGAATEPTVERGHSPFVQPRQATAPRQATLAPSVLRRC
jgi:hypothetical protein